MGLARGMPKSSTHATGLPGRSLGIQNQGLSCLRRLSRLRNTYRPRAWLHTPTQSHRHTRLVPPPGDNLCVHLDCARDCARAPQIFVPIRLCRRIALVASLSIVSSRVAYSFHTKESRWSHYRSISTQDRRYLYTRDTAWSH